MKPSKNQVFVVTVALFLIASGAAAYTAIFTAGSGTAYEAPDGLTVNTATDHGLKDRNPFTDNQTIYVDGVRFSANNTASLTVDAFNASGWTNTSSVDATNASITIAPDGRSNATVAGSPTQFNLANIAVDDGKTDIVVDGSTDTTVSTSELPADTTVYAVDANGQIVDRATTNATGYASFTVHHTVGTHSLDLGNGVVKQSYADSDRHIKFSTNPNTTAPASLVSDSGMDATVTSGTQIDLSDPFPFTNTVTVSTSDGTIEFVGNSPASATVAPAEIEGTYTNLTDVNAANAFTADPADKAQLSIDGAATDVAWTDYAADDGVVDTVVTRPDATSSDLTYYGLAADSTFTAVNESTGTPLAVADTDGGGQATFSIKHSTKSLLLQSGDQSTTPTQSNAAPTGDVSELPSQISVDINDSDFSTDNVSVAIELDGTQIHQEYLESNGTVTTSNFTLDLGTTYTWTVTATDDFGNVDTQSYQFRTPADLTIREETSPYNTIGTATATVKFFENVDDDPVIVERTTTNGKIDLTGLPANSQLSVTVKASGYNNRTVFIDSIFDQSSVFLLSTNRTTVENRFVVSDRTGEFPQETSELVIQKAINRSIYDSTNEDFTWTNVAGDDLGADGAFVTDLEEEDRYRIVVRNGQGDVRILAVYTPETTGTIELQIGSVVIDPEDDNSPAYEFERTNETGQPVRINVEYNDSKDNTSEIYLKIYEYGNESNVLLANTTYDGPFGTFTQSIDVPAGQNDTEWVVQFEAVRPSNSVYVEEPLGPQRGVLGGMAPWLVSLIFLGSIWMTAGLFSQVNGHIGGLVVAGLGAMFWFVDFVPQYLGAGVVALSLLTAGILFMRERGGGGI